MNIFFVGIRSRRKGQRGRWFAQICAKNEQCTEGGLLPFSLILLDRLGGDSSGGLGTVGGLNVGRCRGDRAPCFAGRDTDGEGDQEERHDD